MRVTFDTAEFVRSHGKQPRGDGDWAFRVMLTSDTGCSDLGTVWARGTLAQAKAEVRQRVKQERSMCSRVTGAYVDVLP